MTNTSKSKILNLVGFNAVWCASVIGAANGYPALGPLVLIALILLQQSRGPESMAWPLLLSAGALGYAADSLMVLTGVLRFAAKASLGGPSPIWMVALWVAFATTLRSSLGWLRGRYVLGAMLGAVSGPLSYLAGQRLGAIEYLQGDGVGLSSVAAEWLVAMPALLLIESRTGASR